MRKLNLVGTAQNTLSCLALWLWLRQFHQACVCVCVQLSITACFVCVGYVCVCAYVSEFLVNVC